MTLAGVIAIAAYACSDSDTTESPPATSPANEGGTSTQPGTDGSTTNDASSNTDAGADAGLDSGPQMVGPDGGVTTAMTFFVTSVGKGNGGDFRANPADADGLAGADAFCKSLAEAVSPILGAKTWRAYLSTATVTARSRIGAGPWYNAKGVVIATSVANLHDEGGMNMLSLTTNLDEVGAQVPISGPNVHDILTGATEAGGSSSDHCNNWTSSGASDQGRVGHSNRAGGGMVPTSWNSAHSTQGCAEMGGNSVRSGGGRGSIYCFVP